MIRGGGVLCNYCEYVPVHHEKLMMFEKNNQELALGKMSHLGGFQIPKAITLAFPIPFLQNSTSVFGQLVHPH